MISENHYLIPDAIKENYNLKDRYLLVVTDLESDTTNTKDPFHEKVDSVAEKILTKLEEQNTA